MNNIWLDFSQAVDFQQRLYPQHYPVMVPVMVPIGKAMFMSLPSKDCADSDANHHVYCWSSHWAKPYGGQGQVPHSSAKVVGSNSGQACSDEQSIAATDALSPTLTYNKTRRCVEQVCSTHDSPGAIETHQCDARRRRSYDRVEFLEKKLSDAVWFTINVKQ